MKPSKKSAFRGSLKVWSRDDNGNNEELQGINFYLTPIHPETGEEALIVDSKTNEEINMIVIDNPTKKTARKKSSKIKSVDDK